jgi:hypothetical protein
VSLTPQNEIVSKAALVNIFRCCMVNFDMDMDMDTDIGRGGGRTDTDMDTNSVKHTGMNMGTCLLGNHKIEPSTLLLIFHVGSVLFTRLHKNIDKENL